MSRTRPLSTALRLFGVLVVLLASVLLGACSHEVPLYAAPAALGGVYVRVYEADADDDQIFVKMVIENHSAEPIRIDRDGIALRLPNGRVLGRAEGVFTRHNVYNVKPGGDQKVFVDFRGNDLDEIQGATLVMGGVRFGNELAPRVIGEVTLSRDWNVTRFMAPPPPMAAPPPGPPAPAPAALPADEVRGVDAASASRVAVDVRTLDDGTFRRLDGAALEKQIVVRLVQEKFAVVAPTAQPAVLVTFHAMGDRVLLQAHGPAGVERREVPTKGVPLPELHLELAQKATELVRAVAGSAPTAPAPGPSRSL